MRAINIFFYAFIRFKKNKPLADLPVEAKKKEAIGLLSYFHFIAGYAHHHKRTNQFLEQH
jgi:hypothetical protein